MHKSSVMWQDFHHLTPKIKTTTVQESQTEAFQENNIYLKGNLQPIKMDVQVYS